MKKIDLQTVREALHRILPSYPVAFAYVFGSRVRGRIHKESDLDIAIGLLPPYPKDTFDLYTKLLIKINEQIPIQTEKLDLSFFNKLPLIIQFRVVRDGKLIYLSNLAELRRAVLAMLAKYHDQYPILKGEAKQFFQKHAYG